MLRKSITHSAAIVFLVCLMFQSYAQKTAKYICQPDTYIQFGSGGGFTGANTYYILTKQGYLRGFKQLPADTAATEILSKKVPKREVKKCFSHIFNNGLDTLHLNAPYNVYKTITVVCKGKSNTITWGDPNTTVPGSVPALYQKLTVFIPNKL